MKKLLIVLIVLMLLMLMGCQDTGVKNTQNVNVLNVNISTSTPSFVLNDMGLFTKYLIDIESQTGRGINEEQKRLILDYVSRNPVAKIDAETLAVNRKDFNKKRESLIKEWELKTNQKWPTYQQNVLNDNGKILRKIGDNYDAHHVIELSYNGRNEWWNLIPAAFPNEHQGGIHRKGGPANQIFGKTNE